MHPFARLCIFLWGFFITTSLLICLIGSVYWYYNLKGCIRSDVFEMEELVISFNEIDQINFDLVTAGVVFGTHDGENLVVKFYHSAREAYLLEEMVGGMAVIDRVLVIKDSTPAFQFSTCQYTYVEVLVPDDISLQSVEPISIIGSVKVGYVGTFFLSNVAQLSVSVDVGVVEMEAVNANSVTVKAGLGAISAEGIWAAEFSKFNLVAGTVNTQNVKSPHFVANTFYGTSWNTDITADKVSVHTEYGYATLLRPVHFTVDTNQEVSVEAHYGKALATYDQFYDVTFNLKSGQGHVNMKFDDSCDLEDTSASTLSGVCSFDAMKPTTNVVVNVCHGVGHFYQNEPDFEDLKSNIDYPQRLEARADPV